MGITFIDAMHFLPRAQSLIKNTPKIVEQVPIKFTQTGGYPCNKNVFNNTRMQIKFFHEVVKLCFVY